MNIIKFKDIKLDSSCGLSSNKIELFNNELKGKYAYVINWMYVISFDRISQENYVKVSIGNPLQEGSYLEFIEIPHEVIDITETNNINSIEKYNNLNKYTTDSNVTIDEIKQFRPWVAHMLLRQNNIQDSDIKQMLKYYTYDNDDKQEGSGMYDNVIKQLTVFGDTSLMFKASTNNSCGCSTNNYNASNTCCCTNNSIANLNTFKLSNNSFDAIEIYKMNIYTKMVDTFKNLDFWLPYKDSILIDMKNYVDNIIKVDLPLYTTIQSSTYAECGCLNQKDMEQQNNMKILSNFSQALGYIIDGDMDNHKNFIKDALFKWASILYERMYWMPVQVTTGEDPDDCNCTFMFVEDGDVYIKGVDLNNQRLDYKLLSGQSTSEPIDDNDIVTGDYLESYIEDSHGFQTLN